MSMPNVGRADCISVMEARPRLREATDRIRNTLVGTKRPAGPYGKAGRERIKHALRRKRSVWETPEGEKLRS